MKRFVSLLVFIGLLAGCVQSETAVPTPNSPLPQTPASRPPTKPLGQPIGGRAEPVVAAVPSPTPPPIPTATATVRPTAVPTPLPLAPRTWQLYTNPNTVRQLTELGGDVYAATGGGVVRWETATGTTTLYTSQTGLPSHDVVSITTCELPTPRVVAGTEAGLALYDPATGQWEHWHTGNSLMADNDVTVVACLGSSGGQVLAIGYDMAGMDLYDPRTTQWGHFNQQTGLASNLVRHIALAPRTGYLVVSAGFNVTVITPQGIQTFAGESGLPNAVISAVATTPDGTIWLATLQGLVYGDGLGAWTLIPTAEIEGMPIGVLRSLHPVGSRLWVLSSLGRLCLFDPATQQCAQTHAQEPGMMERGTAVWTAADGTLFYTSAEGEGIRRLAQGTWEAWVLDTPLPSNRIQAVGEDKTGQIWLATDKGLLRLPSPTADPTTWQSFTRATGSPTDLWTTMLVSPSQEGVWLGSYGGLVWFDGQSEWRQWRTAEGLPDDQVRVLAADPNGKLWVGTNTAVSLWDGTQFTSTPLSNAPLSLLATAEGVWIGTQGSGLLWLDGTTGDLRQMALDGRWVLAIAPTPTGHLLLGETRFIYRYNPTTAELMEELPTNAQFVHSLHALPQGGIWAAVGGQLFFGDGATWQAILDAPALPRLNQVFQDSTGTLWLAGYSFNEGGGGVVMGRE